jgi:hypothetical protein
MEPFAESAAATYVVFEPIIATLQLAWPFTEVDRSNLSEFVGRWLGHFGDAATGAVEPAADAAHQDQHRDQHLEDGLGL